MEIKMHKKKNSLPPCLIFNIKKPQTALKLISIKIAQTAWMCKTAIPQFLQNRTKNRAKPHHRKPLRPLYHDSSEFFYRHATVAPYRIPGEPQGNRPEPSVPIRKKISGTQGRV